MKSKLALTIIAVSTMIAGCGPTHQNTTTNAVQNTTSDVSNTSVTNATEAFQLPQAQNEAETSNVVLANTTSTPKPKKKKSSKTASTKKQSTTQAKTSTKSTTTKKTSSSSNTKSSTSTKTKSTSTSTDSNTSTKSTSGTSTSNTTSGNTSKSTSNSTSQSSGTKTTNSTSSTSTSTKPKASGEAVYPTNYLDKNLEFNTYYKGTWTSLFKNLTQQLAEGKTSVSAVESKIKGLKPASGTDTQTGVSGNFIVHYTTAWKKSVSSVPTNKTGMETWIGTLPNLFSNWAMFSYAYVYYNATTKQYTVANVQVGFIEPAN